MLSFFRKKSLEGNESSDQVVPRASSSRSNSISDNTQKDSDALVRELGYNNLTELKETIYGKDIKRSTSNCFAILMKPFYNRHVKDNQRSRKAINSRRLECCLRRRDLHSKTD